MVLHKIVLNLLFILKILAFEADRATIKSKKKIKTKKSWNKKIKFTEFLASKFLIFGIHFYKSGPLFTFMVENFKVIPKIHRVLFFRCLLEPEPDPEIVNPSMHSVSVSCLRNLSRILNLLLVLKNFLWYKLPNYFHSLLPNNIQKLHR